MKSRFTQRKQKRRIKLVGRFTFAMYGLLTLRLLQLQGLQGADTREIAYKGRLRTIVLPARRGTIKDRYGNPLAATVDFETVGFDVRSFQAPKGNAAEARARVRQLQESQVRISSLLGIPPEELSSKISAALAAYAQAKASKTVPAKVWYPIATGISVQRSTLLLSGPHYAFSALQETDRKYACGESAAQVVGFLGPTGRGAAGLERSCQQWLQSSPGVAEVQVDARSVEIPGTIFGIRPAHPGEDVQTTLDPAAQQIATQAGLQIMQKFHPHGVAIVIVEPSTGKIRAMVSLPAYDANPLPDKPGKRAPIKLASLMDRCVGQVYEPGSTMKAFTLSYALDRGYITPQTSFYCSGELEVDGRYIHCAKGEVHHEVNAAKILRVSCNLGAAQVGMRMGGQALDRAFTDYDLFSRPKVRLPGALAGSWTYDKFAQPFSNAKTARSAFGQSVTTTPLALTMGYAAIANHGALMKPLLVEKLSDENGHVLRQWLPAVVRHPVHAAIADEVLQMLEGVVTGGTGTDAAIPGYLVAGKTGTASLYRPGAYTGSFIGIAPASNPRMVILVAVRDPDHQHYYGAEVAAPYFKEIAQRLLALWRVPQDDPGNTQYDAAMASQRAQEGLPPLKQPAEQTVALNN